MVPRPHDPTADARPDDPAPGRIVAAFRQVDGDPRWAWTGRRRNRRLLVAAQALLLVLAVALLAAGRPVLALLAFLPFFPLMSAINVGCYGVLELPLSELDDVMVRLRAEARATAYTLLVVVLGILFATLTALFLVTNDASTGQLAVPALAVLLGPAGLWLTAMLLPRWVLAWQLPEPETDASA